MLDEPMRGQRMMFMATVAQGDQHVHIEQADALTGLGQSQAVGGRGFTRNRHAPAQTPSASRRASIWACVTTATSGAR